ncbi:GNAT family N-acetyltransferase [Rufibacter immobilis]|uniref:GNAT family N-acetyltransferase n=1 Tax=Rufibacter immobilis TaxID=1348778 RepID=UPI0035EB1C1F
MRIESSLYLTGRGVGNALVMAAVAYARGQNIKIHPVCPFAKMLFQKEESIRDVLFKERLVVGCDLEFSVFGFILENEAKNGNKAIGRDLKGKLSPLLYLTGTALSFLSPWAANIVYVLVALMWVIPDRRIERVYEEGN